MFVACFGETSGLFLLNYRTLLPWSPRWQNKKSGLPESGEMERGVRLAMGSLADSDGMPTSMFHARMIYTIVGSTIAFQCLNITLNFTPAPQKYYSEPRFRWRNILTSFTHAMISGFCSIFW